MKQTAVEWYNLKVIELMKQREQGIIDVLEFRNKFDLLFEQAKAMEMERIISFASEYATYVINGGFLTPEQYYNETFKSE